MTHRIRHRIVLALSLELLVLSGATGQAAPSPLRARVLANLRASREARAASGFSQFARRERAGFPAKRGSAVKLQRGTTFGPNTVPTNYVVYGGGGQPNVRFDKADHRMKRQIRRKAAKLRMNNTMKPWAKIERVQEIVRAKVKHAGNELNVKKNPNSYNRYNKKMKTSGKTAKLSDYLKMHRVVCREMAFLTQVALEDAGFTARLVRGDIFKNGKRLGGHAWNEVEIEGKWYIVDTTNPGFNKTDPFVARDQGTKNGWKWKRSEDRYRISPEHEDRRVKNPLRRFWQTM